MKEFSESKRVRTENEKKRKILGMMSQLHASRKEILIYVIKFNEVCTRIGIF